MENEGKTALTADIHKGWNLLQCASFVCFPKETTVLMAILCVL